MLKHYLKIALRGLYKDKAFAVINIVGLAVAITCSFLLIFWIKFETSFEDIYPNRDRIYKLIIEEERKDGIYYSDRMRDQSQKLKDSYPQIESATFFVNYHTQLTVDGNTGDGILANVAASNYDFLRMFALEYIEGSPQAVFNNKGSVILTEEGSKLFFGKESPIGKKLKYYRNILTVEAVVKLPENTNLQFDVLMSSERGMDSGMQFIMLRENEQMTASLQEQLSRLLTTGQETQKTITVQKLSDVHLHTQADIKGKDSYGIKFKYGNYTQIIYFSVAVLLILLMAVINYVNTSIARAMSRMKEVGVRKVTGAKRKELIERFLFESFIITAIGIILSFTFTKYIFPQFSELMGNKVDLLFDWQTIGIAAILCIAISGLSGGYAAFYLSSFKPAIILKGGAKTDSKERLRKGLLGVQFFLSVGILICTVFIYKQIDTIFNESTGMNRKNILVLDTSLWYESENFIKIIKQENPNIIDASMANCPPYNAQWSYTGQTWEGNNKDMSNVSFTRVFCDSHYASTFGLELIQGEFIKPNLPWFGQPDPENESQNIVVNEAFVRLMEVDNPIGVTVGAGKIIGVVKDFNFKPLKEKISPFIMCFNPENQIYMYIKTTGKDKQATLDYILKKYKEMKPDWANRPIVYNTVDDDYNKMYEDEIRSARVLSIFSIISLFLSLMGVVSMVSFMIEKRSKEIAIRKINGAKTHDIILLFWKDIVKTAAIASALVIPICYILMHNWLEGYAYRATLSWWIFAAVPVLLILLTCLIIGMQIIYTAGQRPVESLRNE
ncbi:putative ABC transport system permease protein [Dysgonomonas hofstadii]|uniref:Putative ABC transport system permease protein n=1 Tax=Dysgonomonas hofstadii TaxID=637886 RepID=A0A840CGA4_9BACT|nr:ABC transporter permease [Dysgonomonas hofstadii]MBB4035017.1 putative ABC transport system permease protein [Dysgonomonas hofstadii]